MDVTHYQPSHDVLAVVRQVNFRGVVGPTAVGKSTLIDRVLERDHSVHLVRSTTSRSPRQGEEDGVDMHFRSRQEMEQRIAAQEYVLPLTTFDNYYASAPEDFSAEGISVMPLLAGVVPAIRKLPFETVRIIFVLPPSLEAWKARIAERAIDAEQLQQRMAEALPSFAFACDDPEVLFVLNDDLDVAAESFLELLHGNAPDTAQQSACHALAVELRDHVAQMLNNVK